MRRLAGLAVAALVVAAGCGGAGSGGGDADGRKELEAEVRSYSQAYLSGQAEAAHSILSSRCRARVPLEDFRPVVAGGQRAYGTAKLTTFAIDDLAGDLARVTYRYDVAAIDQEREPWVREDGRWRQDDC